MKKFVLKYIFINIYIYILLFDKYFYKNKEPKLNFRITILNNFFVSTKKVYEGMVNNFTRYYHAWLRILHH